MTELEKIERAKLYMDMLANGIDPISELEAPEQDIINQVRLSRCFFFVSDVLRQVIENGGLAAQKPTRKLKKLPFSLPIECRENFEFSIAPIPVSEITKRVNDLRVDDSTVQLKHGSITGWLTQICMLEQVMMESGRQTKMPTAAGRELGILVETRISANGTFPVVLYDRSAQQFILDNLDAVADYQQAEREGKKEE